MTVSKIGILGMAMVGMPSMAAGTPPGQSEVDRMMGAAVYQLAAKDDDLPMSKDDLFGTGPKEEKAPAAKPESGAELPASKDALFGVDAPSDKTGMPQAKEAMPASKDELFGMDAKPSGASGDKETLPTSRDALFGADAPQDKSASPGAGEALPATKDALFSEPLETAKPKQTEAKASPKLRGYFQTELAYTFSDPEHWSKVLGRMELGSQGRLGHGMQWKVSGRIDYNAVYDLTDFYQSQVRHDQRAEFQLRETYLDFSTGDWDWRLGRQHIVWGEMVGLFFADVVSAKDLREFVLPDFPVLRIPQWAARTEYFKDDFHAELIWIPFPSYDNVGKPADFSRPGGGADFYPYPPVTGAMTILPEDKPNTSLGHGNYGMRVTQLTNGWDLSAFYYNSMSSYPTWYRDPVLKTVFTPRHDRIWQAGGTLGKDMGDFVLKAEAVYTNGRRLNLVTDLADVDGVVKQNTLDWAVGLDFNPGRDTRVNTQFYQSYTFNHNADTIPDKAESGVSLLVSHGFPGNWRGEVLLVHSLNRSDWMLRPKASWEFEPNWKLTFGLDLFGGPTTGLFGQYDSQDRAYAELRYDF